MNNEFLKMFLLVFLYFAIFTITSLVTLSLLYKTNAFKLLVKNYISDVKYRHGKGIPIIICIVISTILCILNYITIPIIICSAIVLALVSLCIHLLKRLNNLIVRLFGFGTIRLVDDAKRMANKYREYVIQNIQHKSNIDENSIKLSIKYMNNISYADLITMAYIDRKITPDGKKLNMILYCIGKLAQHLRMIEEFLLLFILRMLNYIMSFIKIKEEV